MILRRILSPLVMVCGLMGLCLDAHAHPSDTPTRFAWLKRLEQRFCHLFAPITSADIHNRWQQRFLEESIWVDDGQPFTLDSQAPIIRSQGYQPSVRGCYKGPLGGCYYYATSTASPHVLQLHGWLKAFPQFSRQMGLFHHRSEGFLFPSTTTLNLHLTRHHRNVLIRFLDYDPSMPRQTVSTGEAQAHGIRDEDQLKALLAKNIYLPSAGEAWLEDRSRLLLGYVLLGQNEVNQVFWGHLKFLDELDRLICHKAPILCPLSAISDLKLALVDLHRRAAAMVEPPSANTDLSQWIVQIRLAILALAGPEIDTTIDFRAHLSEQWRNLKWRFDGDADGWSADAKKLIFGLIDKAPGHESSKVVLKEQLAPTIEALANRHIASPLSEIEARRVAARFQDEVLGKVSISDLQ